MYISGASDDEDGEKRTAIRPPLLARGVPQHIVMISKMLVEDVVFER